MICVAFVNVVMTVLYVHPMSIVELGGYTNTGCRWSEKGESGERGVGGGGQKSDVVYYMGLLSKGCW